MEIKNFIISTFNSKPWKMLCLCMVLFIGPPKQASAQFGEFAAFVFIAGSYLIVTGEDAIQHGAHHDMGLVTDDTGILIIKNEDSDNEEEATVYCRSEGDLSLNHNDTPAVCIFEADGSFTCQPKDHNDYTYDAKVYLYAGSSIYVSNSIIAHCLDDDTCGSGAKPEKEEQEEEVITSELDDVLYYPNPFVYGVNIEFPANGEDEVEFALYDVQGRELERGMMPNDGTGSHGLVAYSGEHLAVGIYIFHLRVGANIYKGRLVKED